MKWIVFAFLVNSSLSYSKAAFGYPTFKCVGKQTGKLYDASILDVGDEDGEIVVNNGGAPQTFRANYRETKTGQHRWVFGYELYNIGIVPALSELKISYQSGKKTIGKVSYFEHDEDNQAHELITEAVSCKVVSE